MASPSTMILMVEPSQMFWSVLLRAALSLPCTSGLRSWLGFAFVHIQVNHGFSSFTFEISPLSPSLILGLPIHIIVPRLTSDYLKAVSPHLSLQPERRGSWLTKKAMAGDFSFSPSSVPKLKKIMAYFKLEQWL